MAAVIDAGGTIEACGRQRHLMEMALSLQTVMKQKRHRMVARILSSAWAANLLVMQRPGQAGENGLFTDILKKRPVFLTLLAITQ